MDDKQIVSASAWIKGIALSVLASIIGGASKLAIRKSWLMEEEQRSRSTDPNGYAYNNIVGSSEAIHHLEHPAEGVFLASAVGTVPIHESSFAGPCNAAPASRRLPVTLRVLGMIGMTLLNPLCSVLAMNYASPSILAPFSGMTLVWIVLFSQPVLEERPSLLQVVAAALIILGEVIIAVFGDHTNDEGITVQEVRQSYRESSFLLFIAIVVLWMLWLCYFMYSNSTSPLMRRFAWGVAGGSITGFQNFLKDSLTILKALPKEGRVPWVLLGFLASMAIFVALTGLIILTLCMKRYDATYSASMFVGSFCISASIMSAIHYHTFAHLDKTIVNYLGYPIGLIVLLTGVYMLMLAAKEASPRIVSNVLDATHATEEENASEDDHVRTQSHSNFILLSTVHSTEGEVLNAGPVSNGQFT